MDNVDGSNTNPTLSKQQSKSGNALKIIIGIILGVALIIAYYFFISPPVETNPVISLLATHKPINLASFTFAMMNYTNHTNELNISYNGSVSISVEGSGGHISYTMPFTLNFTKYYNTSRTEINAKSVPLLGNFSDIVIKNGKHEYSCTKEISVFGISNNNYSCVNITQNASANLILNQTQILKNLNITIQGIGTSTYKNIPCYLFKGSGNFSYNASFTPVSYFGSSSQTSKKYNFHYNISGCISTEYGIPLNLTIELSYANKSSNLDFFVLFNESRLSSNASNNIAKLPGPIMNTTYVSTSPSYPTTLPITTINTSITPTFPTTINTQGAQNIITPIRVLFNASGSWYPNENVAQNNPDLTLSYNSTTFGNITINDVWTDQWEMGNWTWDFGKVINGTFIAYWYATVHACKGYATYFNVTWYASQNGSTWVPFASYQFPPITNGSATFPSQLLPLASFTVGPYRYIRVSAYSNNVSMSCPGVVYVKKVYAIS